MWALIIISHLHGNSVSVTTFDSKPLCERAQTVVQRVVDSQYTGSWGSGPRVTMFCEPINLN